MRMWRKGKKYSRYLDDFSWLRTVDVDRDDYVLNSEEVKLENALEEAIENEETVDVWKPYVCKSLDFGLPHPGDIVEAASLSTVNLPSCSYPLQDSVKQQIEDGSLSSMQLEGIMFASERHSRYLPDGRRAGFFVGDSAGVGKGRQMAGIILDNLLRGRSRHVWFSASRDLHLDATRDLRDIGCKVAVYDSVASLSKKLQRGDVKEAVVFCTYMELTSQGAKGSTLTRFDELINWLCGGTTPKHRQSFDGVLVFDECHKAKNYFEGKNQKNSTKAGSFVVKLQEQLPNARVVYSSATGISSVENMGYMARMGLWGAHTSFSDFGTFSDAIGGGKSVAALEMLALEFKATGCQVARNVGYHGAEFSTVSANLSPTDAQMYRAAADLWHEVHTEMMKAHELCNKEPDDGRFRPAREGIPKGYEGTTVKMFWSAHQRFMRQLIAALKVPALAHIANESLKAGYCVVIGLQTTGEASLGQALEEEMEEYGLESKEAIDDVLEGDAPEGRKQGKRSTRILASQNGEFVSICKTILRSFILKWFPTKQVWVPVPPDPRELPYLPSRWELVRELWLICRDVPNLETKMFIPKILSYLNTDNRPKNAPSRGIPAYDAQGNIFECQRMQSRLLAKLNNIYLPPSALDDLIDRLGGQNEVAELTGRTIRQVRLEDGSVAIQSRVKATSGNGKRTALYALGNGNNAKMSLNVQEKCAFMDGDKLVAIISEAASTGISLHADRKAKNQRRRVHCTLELPWAADQAIQQLGRSHRTNQTSAPIFRLLSSGLGGEHRFISSVSRRLQSLGALTQGDRRASVGAMTFGEFQFESDHGRNALKALYDAVMARKLPANVDWRDIVRQSWEHMKLDFGEEVVEGDEWTEDILRSGPVSSKKPSSNGDVWCPPASPYMKTESEFFDALEEAARFTGDLHFTTDSSLDFALKRRGKSKYHNLEPIGMPLGRQGPRRLVPIDQSSFQNIVKDVPRFFNRILGLPFSQQALLFNLFNMLLEEDIKEAKRNGKFERGVQILDGQNIARLREPELLYRDPGTGGKLVIHAISRDRGVPFKDVIRELRYRIAASRNPSVKREDFPIIDPPTPMSLATALNEARDDAHFFRSNREIFSRFRTCLAIRIGVSQWKVIRPGTGVFSSSQMADEVLMRNYHVVTNFKKLQKYWNDEFEWSENECTHGPNCKVGSACVVGRRKFETNILTGNVISLWSSLQNLITNVSSIPRSERIMSIVQTNITTTKERVVGIVWPMPAVSSLRKMVADMKREHDVKRRTVQVLDYAVSNVIKRPTGGGHLNFDERERYYQREAEFNRWCSSAFTQAEQLKVLGFALNDECKVVSPTQRALQRGVKEGFQLFLIGGARIEPRKVMYEMRRVLADQLAYVSGDNNRINSLTFLRPYTERDREEDERLWREGLAREPATPVDPEIVARLVTDPATLRADNGEEEPVVPKGVAIRKSKRKRVSVTSARSSDENDNDLNLGDEDDMDLEGTPERVSTGSDDFQLTEAEAAMQVEEE